MRAAVVLLILAGTGWSQLASAACPMATGSAADGASSPGHAEHRPGSHHDEHHGGPLEQATDPSSSHPGADHGSDPAPAAGDTGCQVSMACGAAMLESPMTPVVTKPAPIPAPRARHGLRAATKAFLTRDPPPPRLPV